MYTALHSVDPKTQVNTDDTVWAATGHRPIKLFRSIPYSKDNQQLLADFAVDVLRREQPGKMITGMAIGWDQAIARACIVLKIPFIAAVPFSTQASRWPQEAQDDYEVLLNFAERVEIVCKEPSYAAWKMQARNEWMVNNSTKLLALWNGTPGGTGNCVAYARRKQRTIINVWQDWETYQCAPN